MSLFDLKGRVALVTGGNGGIGLGMARGLAHVGAAIAIAGRNRAKSEDAAAELSKPPSSRSTSPTRQPAVAWSMMPPSSSAG
jgi:NAD(P)-dependent dehydrogenase (short-subunit alcohol dehydrogenase family)